MDIDKQDGLIRAGLALNARRLLTQYAELDLPQDRRYDVTLCLSVIQMLLANSVEWAIATNNTSKREAWLAPLEEPVSRVLAYPGALEKDSFPDDSRDTLEVLTHLRNALSHPRMKDTNPPTTGYTTNSDYLGLITSVTFTDSPDYNTKGTPKAEGDRHKHRGKHYIGPPRIFTIRLDVQQLSALAIALAERLSEGVPDSHSQEISLDRAASLAR